MAYKSLFTVLALLFLCSGCAPLFLGAAAGTAGGTAGGLILDSSKATDDILAERVRSALARHPQFGEYKLKVAAQNGMIKIYGFVPHRSIKDKVVEYVKGIEGVKGAVSRMGIIPPGMF